MRSFDAWDTLIARRSLQDIHDETTNVFPIAENVAKVQPDDIIVSDFYSENLLKQLIPEVTGLTNCVIVTEDGKATGRIWKLLPGVIEHLDDNPQVLARLLPTSIVGFHTKLSNFTKNETALLPVLPNLAKIIREARLRTWDPDPLQRQRQLLQIEANFPMLYCASLLLHRRLKDETVLMSSRDCYLWSSLLWWIGQQTNAKYSVVYWYTSRLCREFPSPAYLEGLAELLTNAVIVDVAGTGRSLSRLLDRMGKPDTPIYLLYQYNQRFMEQAYGPAKLGNIKTFLLNIQGANLERANLAPHPMVEDATETTNTFFNPCNIDWKMPEITIQHEAFGVCLDAARYYPLDPEATDKQLQDAMYQCCGWIKEYDPCMAFATQFLKDEDAAVMQRLKCGK